MLHEDKKKRGKKLDVAIGDNDKNNNSDHGVHIRCKNLSARENRLRRTKKNDQFGQEPKKSNKKKKELQSSNKNTANKHTCMCSAALHTALHGYIVYNIKYKECGDLRLFRGDF